jgi:hypothetical protein
MGGNNKSPDYAQAAANQGAADKEVNRDQTYANRPDQYTPWGYTKWGSTQVTDPSTGKPVTQWTQYQGLTPQLQDIYNKQVAIQGGRTDVAGALTNRMKDEFGRSMDWSGLSPMGTVPTNQFTIPEPDIGDPNAFRQKSQDAMYNMAKSRLDPQFSGKRAELEVKLRNQGIGPEDAAYKSQMAALGQQETDAYNQANWSSVGAGRDESNAMYSQMMGRNQNAFNQANTANQANFGQAMQSSQYANQIRQQQLTEAMQKRGFSLNEINALMSGQQVNAPQMPNFSQATQANAAPIYQAAVAQGNADQAANPMNGLMGLAGTLGGAALGNTSLFG